MILHLTNINCENLESDILLNKNLTNISPSNMYEILFDSENFDKIFNMVLEKIKETTNEKFDVYVKNMWGYIQSNELNSAINFDINFKNQISISSEYSFIYIIKSSKTIISLKSQLEKNNLKEKDILIFKTEDFLKDEFDIEDRIILVGSISTIKNKIEPVKKIMI